MYTAPPQVTDMLGEVWGCPLLSPGLSWWVNLRLVLNCEYYLVLAGSWAQYCPDAWVVVHLFMNIITYTIQTTSATSRYIPATTSFFWVWLLYASYFIYRNTVQVQLPFVYICNIICTHQNSWLMCKTSVSNFCHFEVALLYLQLY